MARCRLTWVQPFLLADRNLARNYSSSRHALKANERRGNHLIRNSIERQIKGGLTDWPAQHNSRL
jgi:hypothetical protein